MTLGPVKGSPVSAGGQRSYCRNFGVEVLVADFDQPIYYTDPNTGRKIRFYPDMIYMPNGGTVVLKPVQNNLPPFFIEMNVATAEPIHVLFSQVLTSATFPRGVVTTAATPILVYAPATYEPH